LPLGYGRTKAGHVGTSTADNIVGFDVSPLRTSDNQYFASGATVTKSGGDKYTLIAVHNHSTIDSRTVGGFGITLHAETIKHPEGDHDHDRDHAVEMTQEEANADIDNRKLIRSATITEFAADNLFAKKMDESYGKSLTILPGFDNIYNSNFKWRCRST